MPTTLPPPRAAIALKRGFRRRCPNCGKGPLYQRYLKIIAVCEECREELGHIRADDIPAYFTIFIVGHVVVGLMVLAISLDLPGALVLPAALALTVGLTLLLLPSVKGVVAAHLWRLRIPRGSEDAEL
jgi:uncharacterized protein (DUF983 family)